MKTSFSSVLGAVLVLVAWNTTPAFGTKVETSATINEDEDDTVTNQNQPRSSLQSSRCGCSSCTPDIFGRDAKGFKVSARINWVKTNRNMSEEQACGLVCGDEFPKICGSQCDPDHCSNGGGGGGRFKDISYNEWKATKRLLTFKRFSRQANFEGDSIRRKSNRYAELVGSKSINTIVGHTINNNRCKNCPFDSPSILPNGKIGNGFNVETRHPYALAFGYRTELTLWEHDEAPVDEGKSFYYSFQLKLDQDFPVPSHWFIVNQLHQMPGSYASNHSKGLQPPFSIQVASGNNGSDDLKCKIVLKSHSSTSLGKGQQGQQEFDNEVEYGCGTLPRDKWLAIMIFVKPSPSNTGGVVGVHIADFSKGFRTISGSLYKGPFTYNNGEGIRNKIGVYSSAGNRGSYKVIFDGVWVE